MHDRQSVGIDRLADLLGHVVVHDAQEASGEKEADCVVAVPPLDHGIDRAGVDVICLEQIDRQRQIVDDMQQGDRDDERPEEPVGDVDVGDPADADGAEEQHRVGHPDHGDQQIDRPFQLGVFLALGQSGRQRHGSQYDHCLPTPEHEARQAIGDQSNVAGALDHIEAGREQRTAAEGEDHRIGVQRSQAAVAQPRDVEVERGPVKLRRDDDADQHADDAPDQGHHGELPDHFVVVRCCRLGCHIPSRCRIAEYCPGPDREDV